MPGSAASRLRGHGLPLFAVAVLGLLVGHALAYVVAFPDPHHRDAVLLRTGHAYLPSAVELAIVLGAAGVATALGRALGRGAGPEPGFASLAIRLAGLQVVAFGGQEVAERLAAHAPIGGLLHDPVLAIGVATQLVVAVAGALVLRWLVRITAGIAATFRPRIAWPRPALSFPVGAPTGSAPRTPPRVALAIRAPPGS